MDTKGHNIKQKQVTELAEKIKNAKTLMIVSVKGLPSKQFQEIKKSIRGHALIKITKKNIMLRALKETGKESALSLEKEIKENSAFAISDIEGYELAGILSKKKNPVFAKAGQIAPEDIEVKEGPTDLVPGPAISELGSLGIQVAVENGKITIKKNKVIVKKDNEINDVAASILQKLNIQPFNVGLKPRVIYDIKNEDIYKNIHIDSEETVEQLKSTAGKSLGFAQKIVYYCKETIGYLLAKAYLEAEKLKELQPKEENKEETIDNTTESKAEESKENAEKSAEQVDSEVKPKEEGK